VATGTITIIYGKDANEKINGLRLDLQPLVNANGDVVWVCGYAVDPVGTSDVPSPGATASPDGASTLAEKHVPASCRSNFGGKAA
jgi:hypothetical protein